MSRDLWHDYIETVKLRVPRDLHPAALTRIQEYLGWAQYCAETGDIREVMHYLGLVQRRIVQELRWDAESCATGRDYREAYQLRRQADRIEAGAP